MATSVKWTGKVVGGILGMLTLGPIGAAVGLVLGHQFDEHANDGDADPRLGRGEDLTAIGERFFRATFRVMGYLAKADGRVSEREIAAARGVMSELHLNPVQVRAAIDYFSAGKQHAFSPAEELTNLRQACQGRPELLRVFLEIQVRAALSGNNLEGPVRDLITRVAARLGIPTWSSHRSRPSCGSAAAAFTTVTRKTTPVASSSSTRRTKCWKPRPPPARMKSSKPTAAS